MKFLCQFFLLFSLAFTNTSFGNEVAQGPFTIPSSKQIVTIHKVPLSINGDEYPYLTLEINDGNINYIVDKYQHDGSEPEVKSVFFMEQEASTSIYTIVSWLNIHKAENINATYYRIYSYKVTADGRYKPDSKINNDLNLRGYDGTVNGKTMSFKYKNASAVKKYIKNKH